MVASDTPDEAEPEVERRVIKRYSNRKLYDTKDSRYVTLLQIADMVRAGEDVQIIDNSTKEDKTDVTLALIISEELKAKPRGIPLQTLKALIRHRGEKLLTQLREGPMGRFSKREDEEGADGLSPDQIEVPVPPPPIAQEQHVSEKDGQQTGLQRVLQSSRATIEQWQHAIDERVRAVLPDVSGFREIQAELKRINGRLDALEQKLGDSTRVESESEAESPGETPAARDA